MSTRKTTSDRASIARWLERQELKLTEAEFVHEALGLRVYATRASREDGSDESGFACVGYRQRVFYGGPEWEKTVAPEDLLATYLVGRVIQIEVKKGNLSTKIGKF